MSGGLLDQHRHRTLWTDYGREQYYRALAENCEKRLATLRAQSNAAPDQVMAEQVALQGAQRELQKARIRTRAL
jgi:hypothetical protein